MTKNSLERAEKLFCAATNHFAIKLYQEIVTNYTFQNVLFSPLCLTASLLRVAGVAQGDTMKEISDILGIEIEENIIRIAKEYTVSLQDSPVTFLSKMFIDRSLCESDVEAFHCEGSDVGIQEFKVPEKSRFIINHWAEDESQGDIKELLPDGAICESSVFILTTGVYFKTHWSKPFFRVRTKEHYFEVEEDEGVKVEMMEREDDMLYGYSDKLEAELIQLDFNADNLSMVIILPEQQLNEFEGRLENTSITEEIENLEETSVRVRIPKFIQTSTRNFKEILQNELSYDITPGPFSLFSRKIPFTLTSIFHKAVIEVEEGPEPSEFADSSTLKEKPVEVFCDHPFIPHRKSWVKRYWQRVRASNPVKTALPVVDKPDEETEQEEKKQ